MDFNIQAVVKHRIGTQEITSSKTQHSILRLLAPRSMEFSLRCEAYLRAQCQEMLFSGAPVETRGPSSAACNDTRADAQRNGIVTKESGRALW